VNDPLPTCGLVRKLEQLRCQRDGDSVVDVIKPIC
jgi:hypothetical protein